jgi:hypothetical protein
MTTKQENKLSMYLTVADWFDKNPAKVQNLPQFNDLLAEFKTYLNEIKGSSATQQTSTKGLAKQKSGLRETLLNLAIEVVDALKAYAALNNQPVLAGEVNYNLSKLKKAPDTILHDIVEILLQKAQTNLTVLNSYGIEQSTLDQLQQTQQSYYQAIPDPRTGAITRKGATTSLSDTFAKADALLKEKIDLLLELLKKKDTQAYNAYRSTRKIVNLGSRKQKES